MLRLSMVCLLLFVFQLSITPARAFQDFREWEDRTGQFKFAGSFVSEEDDVVTLRNVDGTEYEILLDELSLKDQIQVRRLRAQKSGDSPLT